MSMVDVISHCYACVHKKIAINNEVCIYLFIFTLFNLLNVKYINRLNQTLLAFLNYNNSYLDYLMPLVYKGPLELIVGCTFLLVEKFSWDVINVPIAKRTTFLVPRRHDALCSWQTDYGRRVLMATDKEHLPLSCSLNDPLRFDGGRGSWERMVLWGSDQFMRIEVPPPTISALYVVICNCCLITCPLEQTSLVPDHEEEELAILPCPECWKWNVLV